MRILYYAAFTISLIQPLIAQTDPSTAEANRLRPPRDIATPRGAGGAADFDSLMNLIRTTIEPDTWIDNGGTSRMEPYAGGILLNAQGMIAGARNSETSASNQRTIEALVASTDRQQRTDRSDDDAESWLIASKARSISLRALQTRLAARSIAGLGPDEAMKNLAGITRLFAAVVSATGDDIILVGSAGSLRKLENYGWCDINSARPTLRLEDVSGVLTIVTNDNGFRCSIDPTQQGIVNVQQVAAKVRSGKLKGDAAAKSLAEALGPQVVSINGINPDQPASLPLVIADRHMKMLALGTAKCPPGIDNYFQWTEQFLDRHGLPDGQLLRLWFTSKPIDVTASRDSRAWSWDETPIQLLSEKEMADAQGQRKAAGQDPRAVAFAKQLTDQFASLPRSEPIYGRLAGLFELTLGLGLAHRQIQSPEAWNQCVGLLATPDDWLLPLENPPRFVQSLVASHSIRRGRQTHQVTVISGGIELNANELVNSVHQQPSSAGDALLQNAMPSTPPTATNWWWDHEAK